MNSIHIAVAITVIALVGWLLIDAGTHSQPREYQPRATTTEVKRQAPRSTMGMTYQGKLGLQLAPNLIMPFDGSGIKIGFGF